MAQIKIKRGLSAHLPNSAAAGEPLFATDTGKLYVGTGSGLKLINPNLTIADILNLQTILNSKLNKKNGTMTGDLNMNDGSISFTRPQTSGGWARGFLWNKIDGTRIGGIGVLGSSDKVSKFYIGYGTSPWGNSALEVYPTSVNTNVTLKEKGHGVWHSGNLNPNALLNRSGGTMTGQLTIEGTAAEKPLKVRGIQGKASYTDADDALWLNYNSNHPVYINGKIAWHAGNFNPASKLDKNATIDAGTF